MLRLHPIFVILLEAYEDIEKIYHANATVAPNMLYDKLMELGADEMEELAHQPKDMVKECVWDGQNNEMCKEFIANGGTKIFVPEFGVCYALNFQEINESRSKSLKADHAGPAHGLKLIFNIQS